MIVGKFDTIKLEDENFKLAFDWICENDLKNLEKGTYEIKGRDVYAMIQEYESYDREVREFETHDNYADVQMVITGIEKMLIISGRDNLGSISKPYNAGNDITFYSSDLGKASEIEMTEGLAVVLFPNDGHMPCIKYDESMPMKKLVIKVRLGSLE